MRRTFANAPPNKALDPSRRSEFHMVISVLSGGQVNSFVRHLKSMRYSRIHLRLKITLWLTTVAAISCNTGFLYEKRLAGKYGLVAVDVEEQMAIGEIRIGTGGPILIPETVYAVGWNDDFIIAKQHPPGASIQPDKSKTNYYILRVADGKVWGPLSKGRNLLLRDVGRIY